MAVLIRHKIWGVEDFNLFGFIPGTESWIGFLPVYPPNWDGARQKAKWWQQKRRGRQKIVTKTKRIIRPFASGKSDKKWRKTCKRVAKNGSSTSKLIRKVLWIGAHSSLAPVAQGHLDSAQAVLCELIDQVGWQEVSSIGTQEDVLSRSNVFCASSFGPEASIRMHQHLAAN